jgi:hypothetical protein
MAIEKIKILGAVLELLAKQHCQFSQSTKKMIFSMAMGADYTFELISIKTSAPQFK